MSACRRAAQARPAAPTGGSCRDRGRRPALMMTSLAVRAISDMRWLETKTVRPSRATPLSRLRIQRTPSGFSPLTGSSKRRTLGSPSRAAAMPRRWVIPRENVPAAADGGEPGHLQHLVDPGSRDVVRLGRHLEVRPGALPGWMDRDSRRAPTSRRGRDISWTSRPVTVTSPLPGIQTHDGRAAGRRVVQRRSQPRRAVRERRTGLWPP
jgi:hypothetical protein